MSNETEVQAAPPLDKFVEGLLRKQLEEQLYQSFESEKREYRRHVGGESDHEELYNEWAFSSIIREALSAFADARSKGGAIAEVRIEAGVKFYHHYPRLYDRKYSPSLSVRFENGQFGSIELTEIVVGDHR